MVPVGFDGELIIIPFTELEIFDFNDSSFGSKLFSLSVSIKQVSHQPEIQIQGMKPNRV